MTMSNVQRRTVATAAVAFCNTLFTAEVVNKIPPWIAQGLSNEDIAARIGCTVSSLRTTCSRLKISLNRRRLQGGNMVPLMVMVNSDVHDTLVDQSRVRNLSPGQLTELMITMIAKDDLFDAVLDDVGADDESVRRKRRHPSSQ